MDADTPLICDLYIKILFAQKPNGHDNENVCSRSNNYKRMYKGLTLQGRTLGFCPKSQQQE